MSQPNPQPASSAQSVNSAIDDDPLLHLHKMSTTAGVGSQEYVAVNSTAVVAVLFGIASVLALLGSLLLIIPIVGVILSIIALKQIRGSNGTQTGRGIAWIALALSALITAGLFLRQGVQLIHDRADKAAIAALCQEYGRDLSDHKFDQAYDLFDTSFKQRVPAEAFKVHLQSIQSGTVGPSISAISWNELIEFHEDPDSGSRTADSVMKLSFKGTTQEAREPARFRKVGDRWLIENLPNTFPPETRNGGRASPQTNF